MKATTVHTVIAPRCRARGRPAPSLGSRPWLRWQVVRETRPVVHDNGIVSSAAEAISLHWTFRAALAAAQRANRLSSGRR